MSWPLCTARVLEPSGETFWNQEEPEGTAHGSLNVEIHGKGPDRNWGLGISEELSRPRDQRLSAFQRRVSTGAGTAKLALDTKWGGSPTSPVPQGSQAGWGASGRVSGEQVVRGRGSDVRCDTKTCRGGASC